MVLLRMSSNILDTVPLRDVATWRGYVNVASTVGRSAGGPIGGFLADTIGWRWYSRKARTKICCRHTDHV